MDPIKKILKFLDPYKWTYIIYLLLSLVIAGLAMIGPYVGRVFFDKVIFLRESSLILPLMLMFGGQTLLRNAIHYTRSYFVARDSYRYMNDIRDALFDKLLNQSVSYVNSQNTGEMLTILNNDTDFIRNCISYNVTAYIEWVIMLIYATVMLSIINPWAILICYVFTPFAYFVGRNFSRKTKLNSEYIRDASARVGMVAQENINGVRMIRAFASEDAEIKKFDDANAGFRDANLLQTKTWSRYNTPMYLISVLPHFFSVLVCSLLVIHGSMTVGDFVAMGGYVVFIMGPLLNLSSFIVQCRQLQTSARRVSDFLDIGVSISSKENAEKLSGKEYDLKLEDISLTLNSNVILENISFFLPQGKSLGVVGATGSGKTTLCNILLRLMDPTSGKITINGHGYKDVDLDSLRRTFAYVPQDVFLFSETIEKNIAFYAPGADHESVLRASKIAQAHGFISDMPERYDTIIGERGIGLSGGQKQRISIARAILKDSPLMIFDDSSSALDTETEKKLLEALYTDLAHKTKIIVAHKISSVKLCDQIIVLDKGRIVESGSHDKLIFLGGKYASIYREQISSANDAAG